METIQEVLNDQTISDYQLIKELSLIIKNHRDNNLPINKDLANKIIKTVLINYQSIDIDYLEYYDDPDCFGEYGDNELYINLTNILNSCDYSISHFGDKRLYTYFQLIDTIIHELTHAVQDNQQDINYLYRTGNILIEDYDKYIDNYDIVPTERYAELRGLLIAYQVLSYVYKESNDLYKLQRLFLLELKRGYTKDLIDPITRFNEIMKEYNCNIRFELEDGEVLTIFEKLYLGLPITKEEYNKYIDIINNIFNNKEKNITKVIKKISK